MTTSKMMDIYSHTLSRVLRTPTAAKVKGTKCELLSSGADAAVKVFGTIVGAVWNNTIIIQHTLEKYIMDELEKAAKHLGKQVKRIDYDADDAT